MLFIMLAWPASAAHAFGIRRSFLEEIDAQHDPALEAAERALARRGQALELARADPVRARELGVGRPDLAGAFDGGLVDLNHAPADAISALPRMDGPLARRVVAVREEVDGFDSVEDLGSVLASRRARSSACASAPCACRADGAPPRTQERRPLARRRPLVVVRGAGDPLRVACRFGFLYAARKAPRQRDLWAATAVSGAGHRRHRARRR